MNLSVCLYSEDFSWMYYSGSELLDTFNILRDLQNYAIVARISQSSLPAILNAFAQQYVCEQS